MNDLILLLVCVISGITTYTVSNYLKRGGVIGSAIVTLMAGIMLPYFFPETGGQLALAAACASYAGMISIENALNTLEMAIISLMTGILFIAASSAFTGVGGRLGAMAAIACFTWLGVKKVFRLEEVQNDKQIKKEQKQAVKGENK